MNKDKHRKIIVVGGNNTKYEGDFGTPTTHIETAKLLFDSFLSRKKTSHS